MDYKFWPTKNWWIVKSGGSGGADMLANDQIHVYYDPLNPAEIKIDDFYCPHGGIHGTHWNGVIGQQITADRVGGQTLLSLLSFTITSIKPGTLEQLRFELSGEIPTKESGPPGPIGASWTAEEGGTGRPIHGGDEN